MKDWLTIGNFSSQTKLSPKALRLYEKMGLLVSHSRGENNYRYYHVDQIELAARIREFKNLGFSLSEIRVLLASDSGLAPADLITMMNARLKLISSEVKQLTEQRSQIENILSSLEMKTVPLAALQRRAIMSFYGKVSIVITGRENLLKTAEYVSRYFLRAGVVIPILDWSADIVVPSEKPYIILIPELCLADVGVLALHPDVVVVKNLGEFSEENQKLYLNLYTEVGPHVNTVFNADDRASIALAACAPIKKGRIFYYTKNSGLVEQIRKIGGVVSDGEELAIFGFNLKPEVVKMKISGILPLEEETAMLSGLAAVLTVGLDAGDLRE